MKQITFILIALMPYISNAQNRSVIKTKLQDTQLNDDFLSWVTTSKDIVDQNKRTETEIDNEIGRIVQSQRTKTLLEIEVPINFKKLVYYGKEDLRKLVLLSDHNVFTTSPNEYKDADSTKYIYRYGNLFIQSTNNSNRDQLNVYSLIRAYLIIKNKYPDVYNILFSRTEKAQFGSDINKNINPSITTYLNANKNYIITIHENNSKALPATTTNYGWGGRINNKAIATGNFMVSDNNNHFIFLNKATLQNGGAAVASKNIYKDADIMDREINYLFDGLIQTLVHERIHNYVGNYQGVDNFLGYIRNDTSMLNGGATYDYIEEPIVTNTTDQIFRKYGGLSNQVATYYFDLFTNTQVPKMKALSKYNELIAKLKVLNNTSASDINKILRINIFNFGQQ